MSTHKILTYNESRDITSPRIINPLQRNSLHSGSDSYLLYLLQGERITNRVVRKLLYGSMYFATLTEVPIIQGLMAQGVKVGPALTMLLAGPAVSLPSILVLRSIMGIKRTLTYVSLVVLISGIYGYIYQMIFG